MAHLSNQVSVSQTAVAIWAPSGASTQSNSIPVTVVIISGGPVYLGGSNVTTSTGCPLSTGGIYSFESSAGALYGIAASGTAVAATLWGGN